MELSDDIDEVEVHGTLIYFGAVCFLLGWTCVTFDAATFPQNSTGCIYYVGVDLETAGQMSVAVGVLSVKPASPTVTVVAPETPFRIAPNEICSVATEVAELTGGAAIADEHLTGEPRMEWIEATEVPDLRGLSEGVVGPPQGVHGEAFTAANSDLQLHSFPLRASASSVSRPQFRKARAAWPRPSLSPSGRPVAGRAFLSLTSSSASGRSSSSSARGCRRNSATSCRASALTFPAEPLCRKRLAPHQLRMSSTQKRKRSA